MVMIATSIATCTNKMITVSSVYSTLGRKICSSRVTLICKPLNKYLTETQVLLPFIFLRMHYNGILNYYFFWENCTIMLSIKNLVKIG